MTIAIAVAVAFAISIAVTVPVLPIPEFLPARGKLLALVNAIKYICFISDSFSFFDCGKPVGADQDPLGYLSTAFQNKGKIVK